MVSSRRTRRAGGRSRSARIDENRKKRLAREPEKSREVQHRQESRAWDYSAEKEKKRQKKIFGYRVQHLKLEVEKGLEKALSEPENQPSRKFVGFEKVPIITHPEQPGLFLDTNRDGVWNPHEPPLRVRDSRTSELRSAHSLSDVEQGLSQQLFVGETTIEAWGQSETDTVQIERITSQPINDGTRSYHPSFTIDKVTKTVTEGQEARLVRDVDGLPLPMLVKPLVAETSITATGWDYPRDLDRQIETEHEPVIPWPTLEPNVNSGKLPKGKRPTPDSGTVYRDSQVFRAYASTALARGVFDSMSFLELREQLPKIQTEVRQGLFRGSETVEKPARDDPQYVLLDMASKVPQSISGNARAELGRAVFGSLGKPLGHSTSGLLLEVLQSIPAEKMPFADYKEATQPLIKALQENHDEPTVEALVRLVEGSRSSLQLRLVGNLLATSHLSLPSPEQALMKISKQLPNEFAEQQPVLKAFAEISQDETEVALVKKALAAPELTEETLLTLRREHLGEVIRPEDVLVINHFTETQTLLHDAQISQGASDVFLAGVARTSRRPIEKWAAQVALELEDRKELIVQMSENKLTTSSALALFEQASPALISSEAADEFVGSLSESQVDSELKRAFLADKDPLVRRLMIQSMLSA